jgi:hypothetical protein
LILVGVWTVVLITSVEEHINVKHPIPQPQSCFVCTIIKRLEEHGRQLLKSAGLIFHWLRKLMIGGRNIYLYRSNLPMSSVTDLITLHAPSDTTSARAAPKWQLLTLPFDIRQHIYEAFLKQVPVVDCAPDGLTSRPSTQFMAAMVLARTCRQTRQEFLRLAFDITLFKVDPALPFYKHYYHHRLPAISSLSKMLIEFQRVPVPVTQRLMDIGNFAPNLRELYLRFAHVHVCMAAADILAWIIVHSPRLSLLEIVVECLTALINSSSTGSPVAALERLAHIAGYRREKLTCYIESRETIRPGTSSKLSVVCLRVVRRGYGMDIEERCREAGVENPTWGQVSSN